MSSPARDSDANAKAILTTQLLEWLDRAPRTYDETMAAWRTSCPRFPIWEDALADGSELSSHTWGERNMVALRHPLSRAIPWLGRWFDMPAQQLPGDDHMPRVQAPTYGASQRMVVSPGREASGLFHMPGGQSGHPFSPYYSAGHDAWASGEPTPFLPGEREHTLILNPE